MRCVVDCRLDNSLSNNFLELNLWGRPSFVYAIDAVKKADCFYEIRIVTDSPMIADYCTEHYPNEILQTQKDFDLSEVTFVMSGRSPCITPQTIASAVSSYRNGTLVSSTQANNFSYSPDTVCAWGGVEQKAYNAFYISGEAVVEDGNYYFYPVPDEEAVVINSANDFELALILKKKQENRTFVAQMIDRIISEKKSLLSTPCEEKSICFIGHSQLDQWNITELYGYKVRNCAISGISSFEYKEKILDKGLLNCKADLFLVMHGTNDIVWDFTIDEIVESIMGNIEFVKRSSDSPVIFLSCLHVNGRLDRSNKRIDEMNSILRTKLGDSVVWVDTGFMDDKYGTLDEKYTFDGLHINESGYCLLQKHIIKKLREHDL